MKTTNRRRIILVALLKVQALIGAGFLLWIFFAGDRADDPSADSQQIIIDTSAMATDTLTIVKQKNHDLIVVKPSAQALQQLTALALPPKNTASEPAVRDYRVSAAIKVFALARVDDHYLLSGHDHWQRDQVCDDVVLQSAFSVNGELNAEILDIALVCRRAGGDLAYDVAGRSLQPDIADLEMPFYEPHDRLQDSDVVIVSP